jgi:hypothetical protein
VFGVSGGRVRFIAVIPRSLQHKKRTMRRYLRLAGVP